MKRVALAGALLVVAGTASATIFAPPSASPPASPDQPRGEQAQAVMLGKPSAPAIVATGRSPVPFTRLPPPPAQQIASLTEPPPDLSQIRSRQRTETDTAKSQIERGLARDSRCVGRSLTSVRIDGNGSVHVQC